MKYKIVGILNLLFGIVQISFPVALYFFIIPRVMEAYKSFAVEYPYPSSLYYILFFLMAYGLANVIIGILLLIGKGNQQRLFRLGVILFFSNFVVGGLVNGILMISVLSPIYNLVP
jgi:hypothetical protein